MTLFYIVAGFAGAIGALIAYDDLKDAYPECRKEKKEPKVAEES